MRKYIIMMSALMPSFAFSSSTGFAAQCSASNAFTNSYQMKAGETLASVYGATANSGYVTMQVPNNLTPSNLYNLTYLQVPSNPIPGLNLAPSVIASINTALQGGHAVTITYTIMPVTGQNYYNFSFSMCTNKSTVPFYPKGNPQLTQLTSAITVPSQGLMPMLGCTTVSTTANKTTLNCLYPSKRRMLPTDAPNYSAPAIPYTLPFTFNTKAGNVLKNPNSGNLCFVGSAIPNKPTSEDHMYTATFTFYPFAPRS